MNVQSHSVARSPPFAILRLIAVICEKSLDVVKRRDLLAFVYVVGGKVAKNMSAAAPKSAWSSKKSGRKSPSPLKKESIKGFGDFLPALLPLLSAAAVFLP